MQLTPQAIAANPTMYQSQLNSKLASLEQIIGADRHGGSYKSPYNSKSPEQVSRYDNITYRESKSSPYGGSEYAKKYWSGPGYLNVSLSANVASPSSSTNSAPITQSSNNNNNPYANSGYAPSAASASQTPAPSASTTPPPASSYQNSANYASPSPANSYPSYSPYSQYSPYASPSPYSNPSSPYPGY